MNPQERYQETQDESFNFEFTAEEESGVLGEDELNSLAAELLGVSQEQEMDQFLGSLIKKVGSVAGKVVRSPIGQALGGVLKTVARQALPMAGAALGNLVVPGAGGLVGGKLASMAGKALGLELEGLSVEESDFEVAKQFVRIASDGVNNALSNPQVQSNPKQVATRAVEDALKKHAPGMLAQGSLARAGQGSQSGRWVRKGHHIVIYGI